MVANVATPVARRRELEDPLNRYLYHRLSKHIARALAPTGVSPNAVSVSGMLVGWAAAWSYASLDWPTGALLGFALLMMWHVLDGADGDLARLTGKASPAGELVDGACDYSAQVMLYLVLTSMLDDSMGWWAWAFAIVAGASHVAQTNHAETQRRSYQWWGYGVPWLKHAEAADDAIFREQNWFRSPVAWLARGYLKLAEWMAPWAGRMDAIVAAAAGDAPKTARIRRMVRATARSSLVYGKALGPNYRTIMLGASMLAGSPLWYYLGQILLLNAILVVSVRHHNAVQRRLVERLG